MTMKFMMLMIPAVYQGGKSAPDFKPDPKKMEPMGRFNQEMGKALKIESLNGLHPLAKGARVAFAKGKPSVTDGPFIESKEVLGGYWLLEASIHRIGALHSGRCSPRGHIQFSFCKRSDFTVEILNNPV
jgi:hypothetical protein